MAVDFVRLESACSVSPYPIVCEVPSLHGYGYKSLLSIARDAYGVHTLPKSTVDYWVRQAFDTTRPRSVYCDRDGIKCWLLYLACKLHAPVKQAYRVYLSDCAYLFGQN